MRALRAAAIAMLAACAALSGAAGQVGHTPSESPYSDLIYRHELTTFAGYFDTRKDPARVAPRNAPLFGVRYALHISGPAHLIGKLAYAASERTVLDPIEPASDRVVLPAASVPLVLGDIGLALSLTGFKSWNRLVPEVNGGLGFVSDLRTKSDVGGFSFGTRFALTVGAGVRYVPGGRFQLRADITDHLYRISYPDSYYRVSSDGTAIFEPDQSKSLWTHNPTFTLGVSYMFWR